MLLKKKRILFLIGLFATVLTIDFGLWKLNEEENRLASYFFDNWSGIVLLVHIMGIVLLMGFATKKLEKAT